MRRSRGAAGTLVLIFSPAGSSTKQNVSHQRLQLGASGRETASQPQQHPMGAGGPWWQQLMSVGGHAGIFMGYDWTGFTMYELQSSASLLNLARFVWEDRA